MFLKSSLKKKTLNLYLPIWSGAFWGHCGREEPCCRLCLGGRWVPFPFQHRGVGVSKAASDPQQSLGRSVPIRDHLSRPVSACPIEERAPAFSSPHFCPWLCGRGGQRSKCPLYGWHRWFWGSSPHWQLPDPTLRNAIAFRSVLLPCKKPEVCVLVAESHLTLCNPTIWKPTRLLCPWNSSSKNTGVGCHCLLQEIFLTQDETPVFRLQADCLLLEARRPPMKCHIYDSKKKILSTYLCSCSSSFV